MIKYKSDVFLESGGYVPSKLVSTISTNIESISRPSIRNTTEGRDEVCISLRNKTSDVSQLWAKEVASIPESHSTLVSTERLLKRVW